jgi:hypothetical protein
MVEIERRPVKCSSQSLFASSRPELSRPSQRSWWATLPPTRRTCCSTNLRRHYDTSTSYPILPIQSVRRQELSPRCSRPSFENSALLDLSLTPSFLPFPSLFPRRLSCVFCWDVGCLCRPRKEDPPAETRRDAVTSSSFDALTARELSPRFVLPALFNPCVEYTSDLASWT